MHENECVPVYVVSVLCIVGKFTAWLLARLTFFYVFFFPCVDFDFFVCFCIDHKICRQLFGKQHNWQIQHLLQCTYFTLTISSLCIINMFIVENECNSALGTIFFFLSFVSVWQPHAWHIVQLTIPFTCGSFAFSFSPNLYKCKSC